MATTVAGVRLWLLVGDDVPDEHRELFAGVTGRVLPWATLTAYWDQRLVGAAERAQACPAVRDDWWPRGAQSWPATAHTCQLHDGRVACLLTSARRELTAGSLTPERMRQRLQAVADEASTTVVELWQLRDAGRDTYTPAEDALVELLPAAHRLNDVHAGMLTAGGAQLQLATGPVTVPPHMRKALLRQRTASILCNGPADWPLLTLFDRYVTGRR